MSMSLLVILGLLVWWWLASLRAREAALGACRRACTKEQVQLLDETVTVRRLGLARDTEGRVRVRRTYGFEFSVDGQDRRQGEAVCLGRSPQLVRADWPSRTAPEAPAEAPLPGRVIPFRGRDGTPRH
ncbi:DUF3301 domain-containing protein [Acidihalobacter prosperus]|uniref:DUF3301 domain-containing protein n=1 Tax=Acidihalobacter prosperus TaxID=160660 RepID=UPI0007EE943A|nr:DUF3301 domain-containing protein [Acidihalobacter prosperus]